MAVRRQHVVSQTVLRRWTLEGHLAAVDLRNGRVSLKAPRATGFVPWFVHADFSGPLEAMWAEVEAQVPTLIAAVENGTAFSDDDVLDGLRQLVAVHVIRSKPMATMWARSYQQQSANGRIARIRDALADPDVRRAVYEHETGLAVVGDVPAERVADSRLNRLDQTAGPGGAWFVENALMNYSRLLEILRRQFVQIGHHPTGGLVLGDSPATTYDPQRQLVGLLGGANLVDSIILMPVTPKYLVSFGRTGGYLELSDPSVKLLNNVQFASALEWIYCVPGSSEVPLLVEAVKNSIADRTA